MPSETRSAQTRPRTLRPALGVLAAALALATPASGRADGARAAEPVASDAQVVARIAWIQRRLDSGTAAADRWWYGWYTGFTALTVVQATVAVAVTDPGARADAAVGAVSSALGVAPLGVFGFRPRFVAADLRELPAGTAAQRRIKLRAAERLLDEAAEDEAFGRSWLAHLAGAGMSVASGVVLAVAYDRLESGLMSIASGLVLTELSIWTQPTDAIDARAEYRSRVFVGSRPAPGYGLALRLDGASLRVRF